MTKYTLSVIVPNYNNALYLSGCIDSIEKQTYLIDELIIVDDCSTDSSRDLIVQLEKQYTNIRSIFLKTNEGVSHARNVGILESKSKYITFLDADDIYENVNKLEREMKIIMEYGERGIDVASYSKVIHMDEKGILLNSNEKKQHYTGNIFQKVLCTYDTSILPRDYCIKKELIESAGAFNENMHLFEDYDLLLRITKICMFVYTGHGGTAYRLKSNGLSARSARECDEVFMSIFYTYIKNMPIIKRTSYLFLKSFSFLHRRYSPFIIRLLTKVKRLLKRTVLYRIKEKLRQTRKAIFIKLIFHNLFIEKKFTVGKQVVSMEEYRKKRKIDYRVVEKTMERPVYQAAYFEYTEESVSYVKTPEIYVTHMKNIGVIGGCGALFTKHKCILDILAEDNMNRYDYVSTPICFHEKGKLYVKFKNKDYSISKAIYLCGAAPFNYYHFTIEIISRLEYIENYLEDKNIPILVDEIIYNIPPMVEVLNCVNRYNRPVIKVNNSTMYFVKELIYASMNTWFPININIGDVNKIEDFGLAKTALLNVRKAVLKDKVIKQRKRKIYISRKNKSLSRLINEAEIESLFLEFGFEIIYPESMSFNQQVEVFTEAMIVAGVSGGAFANIIYCSPDTQIICIIPQEYNFYLYSSMAFLLREKFLFANAEIVVRAENAALSQWSIKQDYCRRLLLSI